MPLEEHWNKIILLLILYIKNIVKVLMKKSLTKCESKLRIFSNIYEVHKLFTEILDVTMIDFLDTIIEEIYGTQSMTLPYLFCSRWACIKG